MFCGNCGKEIIGDTKFCPFCGAEQTAVVTPAASIPVSAPIGDPADMASIPNVSSAPNIPNALNAACETATSASIGESVSAPIESASAARVPAAAAATAPAATAAIPSVPTPNAIPTSNIDMPETTAPSAAVTAASASQPVAGVTPHPVITVKEQEKEKPAPERKYSLKHIVMCLAAAAVMAVAAGVFAGLYFSVIFTN